MKSSNTYTVYGIKNCDTVKKALRWLNDHNVAYDFHDYKSKGIEESKLKQWIRQIGWEPLVNKKGQTWRKLSAEEQQTVTSNTSAIKMMREKTSLIKRPLVELDGKVVVLGFDEDEYVKKLG